MHALILLPLFAAPPLKVVFPIGVSAEFESLVRKISAATEAGDWAKARGLVALAPEEAPKVTFEAIGVSRDAKDRIAIAFDNALFEFTKYFEAVKARSSTTGTISIKYADVKATKIFFGAEPGRPRLGIVFPLTRLEPARSVGEIDVQNDVLYALVAYFGVANSKAPRTISGRTDASRPEPLRFAFGEVPIMRWTLQMSERMRRAIETKTPIEVATASAEVLTPKFEFGKTQQGEIVDFDVKVANRGQTELVVELDPDCGCITGDRVLKIAPGQTGVGHVSVDTSVYSAPIHKSVFVTTNDPRHARSAIPISIEVVPRYTVILPPGKTVVRDKIGNRAEVYLLMSEGIMTEIRSAILTGANGKVRCEPWSGSIVNPETNERLTGQTGYKFIVDFAESQIPGRIPATITATTNDEKFPRLQMTFNVQSGIFVAPESLFLGEVGKFAVKNSILVSRPGSPFRIKSVTSSSIHLKTSVTPVPGNWEYKVGIEYTGGAVSGDFNATVRIVTDDPKRPVIEIPVTGTVR